MYSLTRILQRRRHQANLADLVGRMVHEDLAYRVSAAPSDVRDFHNLFQDLMAPTIRKRPRSKATATAADSAVSASARAACGPAPCDVRRQQIAQLSLMLNGRPGALQHCCRGSTCCPMGRRSAVDKVTEGVLACFYTGAVPVYNPARWTKQIPSLQWVGGQLLLGILPRLWKRLFPGSGDEAAQASALQALLSRVAEDDHEESTQWHAANRSRISRASAFLQDSESPLRVMLDLYITRRTGHFLAVLLPEHEVELQQDEAPGPQQLPALQAVWKAYLRHQRSAPWQQDCIDMGLWQLL